MLGHYVLRHRVIAAEHDEARLGEGLIEELHGQIMWLSIPLKHNGDQLALANRLNEAGLNAL